MTASQQHLPDGTIELIITVPWEDIKKTYDEVVTQMVASLELPGFRKGKAPRDVAEKKIDTSEIYESVIRTIIPETYGKALTDQKIHPIVSPKIELKEAKEGSNWVIRALTCERPTVTLNEYKARIKDAKAAEKAKDIWVPGKEPKKEEPKNDKPNLDVLLKALYEAVTVAIPNILVEQEANRMLSQLIDQTKKLGLTVEQYLSSTGKTAESVRSDYENQAKHTLTLEFALEQIADTEGILVSDDEIDAMVNTAKTEKEKEELSKERYYLASVLRRQKTLDFIASL